MDCSITPRELSLLFFARHPIPKVRHSLRISLSFEARLVKAQYPTVFSHSPDDVLRYTAWDRCVNLECYGQFTSWPAHKVLNDLLTDLSSVSTY